MSNHGALEPTNMFITGPVAGFVSSAAIEKPIVSGNARSRITSVEPQFEQNPRLEPGEDSYHATVSSPESQLNEETVAGPHVQKAAPVAFRHIEQWQLPNGRSGSTTSNRTRLHRQEPTCAICAPCTTPNGSAFSGLRRHGTACRDASDVRDSTTRQLATDGSKSAATAC